MSIHNEMSINKIDENFEPLSTTIALTEEEYVLIANKCPKTIYIIKESGTVYMGDTLVGDLKRYIPKYLMTLSVEPPLEYIIYFNQKSSSDKWYVNDNLIEIQRYNDPQECLEQLHLFNRAGSHELTSIQLYNILVNYIDKNIHIHDLLIGLISLFGYKNDPRLQEVIQVCISHGTQHSTESFPVLFLEELSTLKDSSSNHLFKIYSDLYDVLLTYNFFKDRKFQKDPVLADAIRLILYIWVKDKS